MAYKIVIDPGHGGQDPGAVFQGRQEKNDVLDLGLAVGQLLEDRGIDVVYTRVDDVYNTPLEKATMGNNADADLFVSIHRNAAVTPGLGSGAEVLVYNDAGLPASVASSVLEGMEAAGFENRGVTERKDLVVLRRTRMPAVLLEVGFIDNPEDNAKFDANFELLAQNIADGILRAIPVALPEMDAMAVPGTNPQVGTAPGMEVNPTAGPAVNMGVGVEGNTAANRETNMSGNPMVSPDNMTGLGNSGYIARMPGPGSNPYPGMGGGRPPYPDTGIRPAYPGQSSSGSMNPSAGTLYRVQTGAFRERRYADAMRNELLASGFPAFILYRDGLYKVQVGAFAVLENAIRMERVLREYGYNTYITTQ